MKHIIIFGLVFLISIVSVFALEFENITPVYLIKDDTSNYNHYHDNPLYINMTTGSGPYMDDFSISDEYLHFAGEVI